jgi:tetratricopeptide (TPR) repeat protein
MSAPAAIRSVAVGLAGAACLAGAVGLQVARERWYPARQQVSQSMLYIRSGEALKRTALSYDGLLADVYWIRAVQHFGRTRLSREPGRNYDLLYPLLDLTTTLDPQFNIAYRFGAVFLAEGYPNGPGKPMQAVALLKKGFAANPKKWQYLQDIGFVYYWWMKDYTAAAHWFKRAGEVPGAPEWLPSLAAVTLARGGARADSRFLWQQIRRTADQEYLKKAADHRLVQLDILDELDRLNALIARVEKETRAPLRSWEPLVRRGWLRRNPPLDPSDVPYVIDLRVHRATLSPLSRYFPLPGQEPSDRPATAENPS